MKFDRHLLKEKPCCPLSFQETIVIPEAYRSARSHAPVHFEGSLIKGTDFYTLEGFVDTTLFFFCDKCLEEVALPLQLPVYEIYQEKEAACSETGGLPKSSSLDAVLEDAFCFEGRYIDFLPAMEALICMNIPLRVLCGEECKGLCPLCGANLNLGDCGCQREARDPRFEILRSFFTDKEV